jgi:hypothetical protein
MGDVRERRGGPASIVPDSLDANRSGAAPIKAFPKNGTDSGKAGASRTTRGAAEHKSVRR